MLCDRGLTVFEGGDRVPLVVVVVVTVVVKQVGHAAQVEALTATPRCAPSWPRFVGGSTETPRNATVSPADSAIIG
jgi:hypothetical protein